MKALNSAVILIIILTSCGGSLPDEQRRQMRQKMEENEIVRVTEVEITEAAFKEGRRVTGILDSLRSDSAHFSDYVDSYPGDIRLIRPGEETIRLLEQQLVDAYLADTSGYFQDNVQNVRNENGDVDTILYTKPLTRELADGRDELIGVWNIWLSKREIVKNISKEKLH